MFEKYKTKAKRYRHTFLLPLISKVIGKWIHNQGYLHWNELLKFIHQISFTAKCSKDTSLSWLTNLILNSAQNGKYIGMVSIDLQIMCDTLDQKILLKKRNCLGFSDKTMKWFHLYLTKRDFLFLNQENDNEFTISRHYVIVIFFFFSVVFFSLSNLITGPSFKSMPSLVMELWIFF